MSIDFKKNFKKIVLKHFFILLGLSLFLFLSYSLGEGCFFRKVTQIPCPGCGMTRSVIALFHGDISLSLFYNPMTLLAFLLIFFAFHKKFLPLPKRVGNVILIVGSVSIFFVYFLRLLANKIL